MDSRPWGLDPHRCINRDILTVSLDRETEEFKKIQKYFDDTQGEEPLPVELLDVIRITKPNETGSRPDFGEKTLLWHGTRKSNIPVILNNGLTMETLEEVEKTGVILEKGIYFADSFVKSAQCSLSGYADQNYILLCEVALGRTYVSADFLEKEEIDNIVRKGYNSIKALGRTTSSGNNGECLNDADLSSCSMQKVPRPELSCVQFNEFVVFDEKRIEPKYIVHFLNRNVPF